MITDRKNLVNFCVITVFFTFEAFVHYSIGKASERHGRGRIRFILPSWGDAGKIILVVIIFAALSSAATVAVDEAWENH